MGRGKKPPPGTHFRPKMRVLLGANGIASLSQLWRRRPPPARRGGLSLLELLPGELLQAIYVFSLYGNGRRLLSLPRASYYLGRVLSTEDVYIEVLLAGFSIAQLYRPPDYHQQMGSYNNLPKRLLRLPWFSSRLVRLAHIRFFMRMALRHYCPPAIQTKKQVDQSIKREIRSAIEDSMDNCGIQPPKSYSIGDDSYFTIKIRSRPMTMDVITTLPGTDHRDLISFHSFMCGMSYSHTPVPRKFLCPPWTEEKCSIIETLLVYGAVIVPADHEYAVAGLENAIRTRNLRVVTALLSRLEPKIGARWPGDRFGYFSTTEKGHSCSVLCTRSRDRSLGLGVTRELLRIAILEAPFDVRIVNCLLHARCDSKLKRRDALWDDDLLEWATKKSMKGDEVGSWLLSTIIHSGL